MNLKKIFLAVFALLFVCNLHAQIVSGSGIDIRILNVPPLEKQKIDGLYSVSSAGTVRMPMLNGEISLAGMSTNAAAAKLEAAYKDAKIYSNPTFQIIATDRDRVRQDMVTVSGSVRQPGPKPYSLGLTLYQAVAAAGGATEFGDMKKVLLMRGSSSQVYDLNNLKDRSIEVKPNDTIEVPEKGVLPF